MPVTLDLHDIQGNIVKPYGRFGYPKARYVFIRVHNAEGGREFLGRLIPTVTTSAPWSRTSALAASHEKPPATTNVAFTFRGLQQLGVPDASMHSFADEFTMGMKARRDILGDDGPSAPNHWDPIWQSDEPVHIMVWFNGGTVEALEGVYQRLCELVEQSDSAVEILAGHRGASGAEDLPYQEGSAVFADGKPTAKEHFGYTDGISNPYFKGTEAHPSGVIGGGKRTAEDPATAAGWEPLETGEFILGHKDEAFEYPDAPIPRLLAYNGTFMVYRKLHENVGDFNKYLDEHGADLSGGKEALAAKFAGRWRNGAPITTFRTEAEADEFAAKWVTAREKVFAATGAQREEAKREYVEYNKAFVAFDYNKDLAGAGCPVGAHMRRANPRGSLEYGETGAFETPGALANRRRLIRRGLPYGEVKDPSRNDGDHGIIIMLLNANIQRQFEFVQQQWVNYSNDFKLSNDRDPIIGNHGSGSEAGSGGRMTIQADPSGDQPPTLCRGIPRFVETRGGDYFFIPSLTSLRMIALGLIDPT